MHDWSIRSTPSKESSNTNPLGGVCKFLAHEENSAVPSPHSSRILSF
jgi:hypothetical protein